VGVWWALDRFSDIMVLKMKVFFIGIGNRGMGNNSLLPNGQYIPVMGDPLCAWSYKAEVTTKLCNTLKMVLSTKQ